MGEILAFLVFIWLVLVVIKKILTNLNIIANVLTGTPTNSNNTTDNDKNITHDSDL